MAAIDFAPPGRRPPLLAGFVIAVGIVAAGEKGALDANILEAATDPRSAAMVFAQCMTGSDIPGSGPRAKQAHDAAMGQIKTIASGSSMEVEELMTELRQNPASDFNRVYSQSRNQIYSSFDGEVRGTIIGWRKEHEASSLPSRPRPTTSKRRAASTSRSSRSNGGATLLK